MLKRGMASAQPTSRLNGQGLLLVAARSPWIIGGLAIFARSALPGCYAQPRHFERGLPFNAAGYVCFLVASSVTLHRRTNTWMWIGTVLVATGLAVVFLAAP
jgi:hypothetical protein